MTGTNRAAAAMVVVSLGSQSAFAQTSDKQPASRPHERESMPYLAPPRPLRTSLPARPSAPGPAPRSSFVSIQINTTADGMNIVGDAANEPSLCIDPTAPNRIAVGWRQFDNVNSDFRQAGNAYSRDGGRTWHVNPVIEPGIARTDPVLESDAQGRFFYNSYKFVQPPLQVNLFRSDDGGRTWLGGSVTGGGDRVWMTIDRTGGIGSGNVYQIWNSNRFNRSIDAGMSFQPSIFLSGLTWRGSVAVGLEGQVFAVGEAFRVFRSLNAQNPMETPVFTSVLVNMGGPHAGDGLPNPGGGINAIWIDVDRSSGSRRDRVYLCSGVNPTGVDPADLMISASSDGGLTWVPPSRINSDPQSANNWQWFSTMSVAPNGRIDAVWNDTRGSNTVNLCRTYYAWSDDGGQTWQGNIPIGPEWNSHHGWPVQQKIGDYYDMESDLVGASLVYATTYNRGPDGVRGEQDVYFVRLGDYDCNGNGIGDTIETADGTAADCNANGIPDSCEIAAGTLPDADGDGIPDRCSCPGDFNSSGSADEHDVYAFLNAWFAGSPEADVNRSGTVSAQDLFDFLAVWFTPCP